MPIAPREAGLVETHTPFAPRGAGLEETFRAGGDPYPICTPWGRADGDPFCQGKKRYFYPVGPGWWRPLLPRTKAPFEPRRTGLVETPCAKGKSAICTP
jgi:hypothetical protein